MSGTLTYTEVNWDPSSAIKSGSSDCYDAFGTLNQFTGINSEGSEVTSASDVDFCTAVWEYLQSTCWEALISNIWSQFCRNKLHVAIVCIDVLRIDICVYVAGQFPLSRLLAQNHAWVGGIHLQNGSVCCNCDNFGPKLDTHSIE